MKNHYLVSDPESSCCLQDSATWPAKYLGPHSQAVACHPCDSLRVGHHPCLLFGPLSPSSVLLLQPGLRAVQDAAAVLLSHLQLFCCVC